METGNGRVPDRSRKVVYSVGITGICYPGCLDDEDDYGVSWLHPLDMEKEESTEKLTTETQRAQSF